MTVVDDDVKVDLVVKTLGMTGGWVRLLESTRRWLAEMAGLSKAYPSLFAPYLARVADHPDMTEVAASRMHLFIARSSVMEGMSDESLELLEAAAEALRRRFPEADENNAVLEVMEA